MLGLSSVGANELSRSLTHQYAILLQCHFETVGTALPGGATVSCTRKLGPRALCFQEIPFRPMNSDAYTNSELSARKPLVTTQSTDNFLNKYL